jgi:hypothetical protein
MRQIRENGVVTSYFRCSVCLRYVARARKETDGDKYTEYYLNQDEAVAQELARIVSKDYFQCLTCTHKHVDALDWQEEQKADWRRRLAMITLVEHP